MVRLREIPRTATFAWSPDSEKPLVVSGTRAGAVDADFSDETKLEIWDLDLDNHDQGLELQPIASIDADSRFYDIAWGPPDEDHPKGIIAGALENGSLELWDAEKLIAGSSDAFISRTAKHTGAIKALQFNPLKPNILATAGTKGELFVYDVHDISNPFRLGTAAARSDDLECLAWNRKVSHILATGGSGGFVTVWDLKTKKASLTLNNNRKAVSAIAWDPNNSTKLLTATPDDNTPVIFLWDLRNSNAPERTLQGHDQGILSLSWCEQDAGLLLSCGKDNRTLVWNPQTGERYGEFPEVTNWTFLTRFHPRNPNLSATAGFDGKITVQTLQNTNPETTQTTAQNNLDGEDFFTKAQTQPQEASFSLPRPPRWAECPIGASFGFGGKLIVFKLADPAGKGASKVLISQFSVDSEIGDATEKFEEALQAGDISAVCEERSKNASSEEDKADWLIMGKLVGENARERVVDYLGFKQDAATEEDSDSKDTDAQKDASSDAISKKQSRLSAVFDDDDADGDDFLSGIAATKGTKTDNPFHIFGEDNDAVEGEITRAVMLGNFAQATSICLKEDRIADAFLIASCGGKDLIDKVQSAYLAKKKGSPGYLRVLGSVINKNLWDVVYNADLSNWKEIMAVLCTFSTSSEFPDLCEALGDRILENGSRKDASFCFMVGSKLDKVVSIWVSELEEAATRGLDSAEGSTFSVHAKTLQYFIEKVTVFRLVSKFQDNETSLTSGWKLAPLYDKYTEYADIVAAHGKLNIAQKYLDLLPAEYPAAEIARSRVRLATQKAAPRAGATTGTAARSQGAAAGSRITSRPQPSAYKPPTPVTNVAPVNPYAPATQPVAQNPYAPPATTTYGQPTGASPYAPSQGYQPPTAQPAYGGYGAPQTQFGTLAPPPKATTPSVTPAAQVKNMVNWNDVPEVVRQPPRRATPSIAPIAAPFGTQPGPTSPPLSSPYGHPNAHVPPPPPPKGSAPPRVSSPLTGPPQHLQQSLPRPSSAANAYAPPPPQPGAVPTPPGVARVSSPYNAPPAAAPPSNRYAPAPTAQPQAPHTMAPPPMAGRPPTHSYTALPPQAGPPPGQYAHTPMQPPPTQTAPPPAASRPPLGPPPSASKPPPASKPVATPPPPRAAATPPVARHPPGDRSHIPANAQRLVDILTRDMQRVAAKAPASFAPQVKDTQKRLGLLFDHLNNNELVKPDTIAQLAELANALEARDYETAHQFQVTIQRDKTEECGNWMVGVKRLLSMSKATP